jgi:hypothetical protein
MCTGADRFHVPPSRGKRRAIHNTIGVSAAHPYQKLKFRIASVVNACGLSENSWTNW